MSSGLSADQKSSQEGVSRVALQVLSTITPEAADDPLIHKPLESYLTLLFDAVLSPDRKAVVETVKGMRRAWISSATIAEVYVPCVARRLGDAWLADTLDFGGVTIGSARLQGLLWRLEKDWSVPIKAGAHSPPAFLVGVPAGNQHLLGATVLAGQLRHRGMSVNLDLELTPERLTRHVINQQLSGVLLSACAGDDLAPFSDLVNISRRQSRNTPVIIGGSILEHEHSIKSRTGADLVTDNLHDVLHFCEAQHEALDTCSAVTL